MTIQVGDRLPDMPLTIATADGPKPTTSGEFFGGKRVALFAVPGAFTPTCSARHLPPMSKRRASSKARASTRSPASRSTTPSSWPPGASATAAKTSPCSSDGNGDFADATGLGMDASKFGMGKRSQRYSMIVNDGVVEQLNVEAPGEYRASSAEYMLDQLATA